MVKTFKKELEMFLFKNPKIKEENKALQIEKSIPEKLQKGIKGIQIKKDTITIITTTASWRQEIMFLKKEMLEIIDKKFPNYNIKKIIIL